MFEIIFDVVHLSCLSKFDLMCGTPGMRSATMCKDDMQQHTMKHGAHGHSINCSEVRWCGRHFFLSSICIEKSFISSGTSSLFYFEYEVSVAWSTLQVQYAAGV